MGQRGPGWLASALALASTLGLASALVGGCTSDGGEGADGSRATTSTTADPAAPRVVPHDGWALPVGEAVPVPAPPLGSGSGTITPIDDGFVLYGGTMPPPGVEPEAPQIFDAETGSWTVVPPDPLDLPLFRPHVVGVPGGFLLVGQSCTGESPGVPSVSGMPSCTPGSTRLARYDQAAGTWTEIDVPEVLQTTDESFSLRLQPDRRLVDGRGQVLVSNPDASLLLDAAAGTWTEVSPVPGGLATPMVCATDDGIVATTVPNPSFTPSPDDVSTTGRYTASLLGDDGTWERFPFDLAAHAVPASTAVLCTDRSALLVAASVAGPPAAAYEFVVADRSWRQVDAPVERVDPFSWTTLDDGVVALGPYDDGSPDGPTTALRFTSEGGTWETVDPAGTFLDVDRRGVFVGRPFRNGEPMAGELVARRLF